MNNKNKKKGFTLTEMLATVIIVILLSLVLTVLTGLASKYFKETTMDADGQTLLSTLTSAVEDELRYATNIEVDGDEYTYFSTSTGLGRGTTLQNKTIDDKSIIIIYNSENDIEYPIVNMGSYVYDLQATIESSYDAENNKFNVTIVVKDKEKQICKNIFAVVPLNPE